VLNADCDWSVRMAGVARGEIIFFSMDEENPVIRDHRRERGRAVVLRQTRAGEMLTLLEDKEETSLLLGGRDSSHTRWPRPRQRRQRPHRRGRGRRP
jgi:hypothetical protein